MRLKDECDRFWRTAVRIRDEGRCRRCGGPGQDAAHIFDRDVLSTRWIPENGLYLCRVCHTWAGTQKMAFYAWAREQVGGVFYDMLAMLNKRITHPDLHVVRRRLQRFVQDLQIPRRADAVRNAAAEEEEQEEDEGDGETEYLP